MLNKLFTKVLIHFKYNKYQNILIKILFFNILIIYYYNTSIIFIKSARNCVTDVFQTNNNIAFYFSKNINNY